MACVSVIMPEFKRIFTLLDIRVLLEKVKAADKQVENWPSDQVDSCLYDMAMNLKIFPNRKQLKRKTVRENNVTFHDGQPVTIVSGGSNTSECFILIHKMLDETERFLTFFHYHWPSDAPISAGVLAKAGFYYFGVNDTVQCFSCNERINNWAPGDTAMGEHRRLYPRCKFVNGTDKRNVPSRDLLDESVKGTGGKQSANSESSSSSEDEAGCSDLSELLRPLTQEECKPSEESQSYFQSEFNRLLSFKFWPMSRRIALAAAGFYCVNESSGTVQCFACFGRLSNWKLGDQPRSEHQRLFSSCPFVLGVETGDPLSPEDKYRADKYFASNSSNLRQPLQIASNLSQSERFGLAGQSSSSHGSSGSPLGTAASPEKTDLTLKYAKYAKYADEHARLETYGEWPRHHSQIPANLARAGFFATEWLRQKLCKLCRNPRDVVFLPCQHMVTCEECSKGIIKCIESTCGELIENKIVCVFCTFGEM